MYSSALQVLHWLRFAAKWVFQARLAIFAGGVALAAVCVSLFWLQTEQSVRVAGLVMQLFGLATAAIGIRDTRRMFSKPSFLELVRRWFRRFPRLKSKVIHASGSVQAEPATVTGKAFVWNNPDPYSSVESRLSAAEKNLRNLYDRVNRLESENERAVANLRGEVTSERSQRTEQVHWLDQKIETATTDGLHLAAVGVFWLGCGVVLSTLSAELVQLAS